MSNRASHSKSKVSTVNLKLLFPQSCTAPYGEIEYRAMDDLEEGLASITWWTGESFHNCEERWSIRLNQARQKQFEIPGIPFKFIIVNGEIYYRRNVE